MLLLVSNVIRYRKIILAVILCIGAVGLYFYARNKGFSLCQAKVIERVIEADLESRRNAEGVFNEVQNLNDAALDRELCNARIMREQSRCGAMP